MSIQGFSDNFSQNPQAVRRYTAAIGFAGALWFSCFFLRFHDTMFQQMIMIIFSLITLINTSVNACIVTYHHIYMPDTTLDGTY